MFHAVLLKLYQENEVYGENFAMPPPDIVEKKSIKLKQSWNIGNKDEDTNTSSNWKDIQLPRPCGNLSQLSLMMVICWMTTNNDINYEKIICQTTSYMTAG